MIGNTFQFEWEVKLIEWCQGNLSPFIIKILEILSYSGDTLFIVLIMGILYLCFDKKIGKKIILNVLLMLILSSEIKNIFNRRRPYFDNSNIKLLKTINNEGDIYDISKQGFSFPSMHSANIATTTGSIYYNYRKKLILLIGMALTFTVGISRFILGCHYPTDVIVGWCLGIFVTVCFSKLQNKLSNKKIYMIVILVGFIGMFFCKSDDYFSSYGILLAFIISMHIDDKYIGFKNTKSITRSIFRILLAGVTFYFISEALKVLFTNVDGYLSYICILLRYFISTLIGLGLTPLLYKYNILRIKE